MDTYDIIFSINVHENKEFLYKQILNIKEHVKINYKIILNCNLFMYKSLKNDKFIISNKVILNPYYFRKHRFHGSILNGHFLNMKYIINKLKYKFVFFTILSSKNIFYNNLEYIYQVQKLQYYGSTFEEIKKKSWWKSIFTKLYLTHFLHKNNSTFSTSPHEGLTFEYSTCINIINFLQSKVHIRRQLFNFPSCVEEFAFQSLSCFFNKKYYNIGTMTTKTIDKKDIKILSDKYFICKINKQ